MSEVPHCFFASNEQKKEWKHFSHILFRNLLFERSKSATYCNQISLAQVYTNRTQNTSVNWIIRLLLSLLCRPEVILLSGGHCANFVCFLMSKSLDEIIRMPKKNFVFQVWDMVQGRICWSPTETISDSSSSGRGSCLANSLSWWIAWYVLLAYYLLLLELILFISCVISFN